MIHDTQLHGATERFLMDIDADRLDALAEANASFARHFAVFDTLYADARAHLDSMRAMSADPRGEVPTWLSPDF